MSLRRLASRVRGLVLAATMAFAAVLAVSGVAGAQSGNAAGWDEQTRALFQAVQDNELSAVQDAVIDGADLAATDDEGRTAGGLAEDLGHFTIAQFLLAYQSIEASESANVYAEAAPEPVRQAVDEPAPTAEDATQPEASGEPTDRASDPAVPGATATADPEMSGTASTVDDQATEDAAPTDVAPAVSSPDETSDGEIEARVAMADQTPPDAPYYGRLDALNPTPADEPSPPESGMRPAPDDTTAATGEAVAPETGASPIRGDAVPMEDMAEVDPALSPADVDPALPESATQLTEAAPEPEPEPESEPMPAGEDLFAGMPDAQTGVDAVADETPTEAIEAAAKPAEALPEDAAAAPDEEGGPAAADVPAPVAEPDGTVQMAEEGAPRAGDTGAESTTVDADIDKTEGTSAAEPPMPAPPARFLPAPPPAKPMVIAGGEPPRKPDAAGPIEPIEPVLATPREEETRERMIAAAEQETDAPRSRSGDGGGLSGFFGRMADALGFGDGGEEARPEPTDTRIAEGPDGPGLPADEGAPAGEVPVPEAARVSDAADADAEMAKPEPVRSADVPMPEIAPPIPGKTYPYPSGEDADPRGLDSAATAQAEDGPAVSSEATAPGVLTTGGPDTEGPFFSQLREFVDLSPPDPREATDAPFAEGIPSEPTDEAADREAVAESIVADVPRTAEQSRIRSDAVNRLERESLERRAALEEVRRAAAEQWGPRDLARGYDEAKLNIQTEERAKERRRQGQQTAPGYVPPPDGGSSAMRFLQRMGLASSPDEQARETAQAAMQVPPVPEDGPESRGETGGTSMGGLPSGTTMQAQPRGNAVAVPSRPQTDPAFADSVFLASGFSRPPGGQAMETDGEIVGTLQQITQLLETPSAGLSLPSPGRLPSTQASAADAVEPVETQPPEQAAMSEPAMPDGMATGQPGATADSVDPADLFTQELFGAEAVVEVPAANAEPVQPPADGGAGSDQTMTDGLPPSGPPMSPEDPDFTLFDDEQSVEAPPLPGQQNEMASGVNGWQATATDSRGNVLGSGGIVGRLTRLFDPATVSGASGMTGAAGGAGAVAEEDAGTWDVVSVQTAPVPSKLLLSAEPSASRAAALTSGISLSLGQSVTLGKAPPHQGSEVARDDACIQKGRGSVVFCIERIDWPSEMQQDVLVDSVIYQGLNAIVRYDNGVATRIYALFPSESFERVVDYFARRFGKPTDMWQNSIAPLASPRQNNPTAAWRTVNPTTQRTTVLEVRKYDDTRGGFPDTRRGAIMLYTQHAGPIFPQVSALELMRLKPR